MLGLPNVASQPTLHWPPQMPNVMPFDQPGGGRPGHRRMGAALLGDGSAAGRRAVRDTGAAQRCVIASYTPTRNHTVVSCRPGTDGEWGERVVEHHENPVASDKVTNGGT